jgi:hypothetical protein
MINRGKYDKIHVRTLLQQQRELAHDERWAWYLIVSFNFIDLRLCNHQAFPALYARISHPGYPALMNAVMY